MLHCGTCMKRLCFLLVILMVAQMAAAQPNLVVRKSGTMKRFSFGIGDPIKLRASVNDTLLKGNLWALNDSVVTISGLRSTDFKLSEIHYVYRNFGFPRRFGMNMVLGSAVFFTILSINHLINNEPVFSPDVLIVSGAMLGAGLISLSFSQKRYKIGVKWKVSVIWGIHGTIR